MSSRSDLLDNVNAYYTEKVKAFGATHQGVDWNSDESQMLRFEQLLKIGPDAGQKFSINDFGCGYGALISYLQDEGHVFDYTGFDISDAMLQEADRWYGNLDNCRFVSDESLLVPTDYVVASGIFNVKLQTDNSVWKPYILDTIERLWTLCQKGLAFNILTKYSDPEYMRPTLYYADPCFLFDHCKRHYSRHVALLHDYDLYEFTILIKR